MAPQPFMDPNLKGDVPGVWEQLNTQSDGMGKELTSGDKDFILDRQD